MLIIKGQIKVRFQLKLKNINFLKIRENKSICELF